MLIHIFVWRFAFPKSRPTALLFIFIILPSAFFILYVVSIKLRLIQYIFGLSFYEWIAAYLLHLVLSCAYILSYPAVEAFSPSLAIILLIGDSQGVLYEDLAKSLKKDVLLEPRIKDLFEAELVKRDGDYIVITSKGRALVKSFIFLRTFLGLSEGKG